ncbi:MAG: RluA family pseudouridine synthase [Bacteroidales bacterium]|nr:RluA family pseudouridine synthase [Bacteroidales bacterium]
MDILFEDNHLIVVNKRAGQLVQGDKTGDVSLDLLLKRYIKEKYKKPGDVFLGVVHRIDRPASGVVVFARTSKALTRMNEIFREKQVRKTYWCIVKEMPQPEQATLRHYLVKKEAQNKSYAYNRHQAGTKEAVLDYKLISRSDNYFLLEVHLHTGRHHQIRTQLAKIGSPVKGDLKYGFPRSNKDAGISLHARSLEFIHPVRKDALILTAPVPNDPLWNALTSELV